MLGGRLIEMYEKLFTVLLGVVAGATGYWINTFWMKPILQYRELRIMVFADFIFYAQVVNAEMLNENMQKLYEDRILSNRRHSANLAACLCELPSWYRFWLHRTGQSPEIAARSLIGYSNTTDFDDARKVMNVIKKSLGFPTDSD